MVLCLQLKVAARIYNLLSEVITDQVLFCLTFLFTTCSALLMPLMILIRAECNRVCLMCPCSDEEIDFEQYSSGYSSAEVSPSDFWVKEPFQPANI